MVSLSKRAVKPLPSGGEDVKYVNAGNGERRMETTKTRSPLALDLEYFSNRLKSLKDKKNIYEVRNNWNKMKTGTILTMKPMLSRLNDGLLMFDGFSEKGLLNFEIVTNNKCKRVGRIFLNPKEEGSLYNLYETF